MVACLQASCSGQNSGSRSIARTSSAARRPLRIPSRRTAERIMGPISSKSRGVFPFREDASRAVISRQKRGGMPQQEFSEHVRGVAILKPDQRPWGELPVPEIFALERVIIEVVPRLAPAIEVHQPRLRQAPLTNSRVP